MSLDPTPYPFLGFVKSLFTARQTHELRELEVDGTLAAFNFKVLKFCVEIDLQKSTCRHAPHNKGNRSLQIMQHLLRYFLCRMQNKNVEAA